MIEIFDWLATHPNVSIEIRTDLQSELCYKVRMRKEILIVERWISARCFEEIRHLRDLNYQAIQCELDEMYDELVKGVDNE